LFTFFSTVPGNFQAQLGSYSKEGYRIIAIGWRTLTDISYTAVQRLTREDVERDLTFGGLVIMENRLKPETTENIAVLHKANIKMVMVTGKRIYFKIKRKNLIKLAYLS